MLTGVSGMDSVRLAERGFGGLRGGRMKSCLHVENHSSVQEGFPNVEVSA